MEHSQIVSNNQQSKLERFKFFAVYCIINLIRSWKLYYENLIVFTSMIVTSSILNRWMKLKPVLLENN